MGEINRNVLDDGRIGRLLIKLSFPAFMGMFVMSLYNVVDTIFIGHYVGTLGIAGLSIVFPVQMLAMGVGMITGMGGASLISRLIGAGRNDRAEQALGNAISLTIVMSLVVMLVGLYNVDSWLSLMGASEAVLPYAHDYLQYILIGMFFQTFAMSLHSLIRAEGNANVPMIGMIIGAVVNIILDAVFIIPLDMGIKGAALATIIAQLISVVYYLFYYYFGDRSYLKIRMRNLRMEWGILRDIMVIGISSFAMMVASSLSGVLMNRVLLAYGGDIAISAFGVVNRLMMFIMMPGNVIAQGMQPIVGFNYGAKRYDRAVKAIKITSIAATVFNTVAFLVVFVWPELFMNIFTNDSELVALSSYGARRLLSATPIVGCVMVGSMVFMALGNAVQAFVTSLARPALFLIPLIYILPLFWQLDGVWWAFPLSDALTLVLTVVLIIPQMRMLHRDMHRGIPPAA